MNKSSFLKLIHRTKNWSDFKNELDNFNNKEKGDAFEFLSKCFFLTIPRYSFYDNVWQGKEVPQKVLDEIGMLRNDFGIDLLLQNGKEYHAVQCKYHSDKTKSVTYKEISTFLALLGRYKKITRGYICSTANITSVNYDKLKFRGISKILSDTWENLPNIFFSNVRAYLEKKPLKLEVYKPRNHQKKAIDKAKEHFSKENRGKLILPCGSGKSLTGFWMMNEFKSKNTLGETV